MNTSSLCPEDPVLKLSAVTNTKHDTQWLTRLRLGSSHCLHRRICAFGTAVIGASVPDHRTAFIGASVPSVLPPSARLYRLRYCLHRRVCIGINRDFFLGWDPSEETEDSAHSRSDLVSHWYVYQRHHWFAWYQQLLASPSSWVSSPPNFQTIIQTPQCILLRTSSKNALRQVFGEHPKHSRSNAFWTLEALAF